MSRVGLPDFIISVHPAWRDAFDMEGAALFDGVNNQITGFTLVVEGLSGGVRIVVNLLLSHSVS